MNGREKWAREWAQQTQPLSHQQAYQDGIAYGLERAAGFIEALGNDKFSQLPLLIRAIGLGKVDNATTIVLESEIVEAKGCGGLLSEEERAVLRAAIADRDAMHAQQLQSAEAARLRLAAQLGKALEALADIAKQQLSSEMEEPRYADYETGYTECVRTARRALTLE